MPLFTRQQGAEEKQEHEMQEHGDSPAMPELHGMPANAGNSSPLDECSGDGLEDFTSDTVSAAYLGMIQPSSSAAGIHEPGTWRNSATDANYGSVVELYPLAFKTMWIERSSVAPYGTVGRYEPHSIEVNIETPKAGVRGFPKMTNPATGNKVEELFVYACVIKGDENSGIVMFSPTVSSMKTCKQWNTLLRSQRLPSGRVAPIYAFSWFLEVGLVQNPNNLTNPKDKIAKFIKVTRGELVSNELFVGVIQPQITVAKSVQLLASPETAGDE